MLVILDLSWATLEAIKAAATTSTIAASVKVGKGDLPTALAQNHSMARSITAAAMPARTIGMRGSEANRLSPTKD